MKDENLKFLINLAICTVVVYVGYLIYYFNKDEINDGCFWIFQYFCKRKKAGPIEKKKARKDRKKRKKRKKEEEDEIEEDDCDYEAQELINS